MSILLIIGIIILVLWLLGFLFFKTIGAIWLLRAVFKVF
jgi:hypothetical protein